VKKNISLSIGRNLFTGKNQAL